MSETTVKTGIGGKVRENQFDDSKVVGLGEVEVIAINPNTEEYKEILGIELKEDSKAAEYLGESDEGNTTLRIDVWVRNVKNKRRDKITFFLEDKERTNKDETKKQYINNIGVCSWATDPNELPNWFVKRDYRVAKNGEEELYNFLRTWLSKLDYRDAETVLQLEWKSLMRNNLRDLKSQINGEYATTFVSLYTVKNVEKNGETKEYQAIYNKAFLPTFALKNFRLIDYDNEEVIATLREKEARIIQASKEKQKTSEKLGIHERFVLTVKGEYGCKDSYVLKDLKEYNPNEFIVASNETMMHEDDEPTY